MNKATAKRVAPQHAQTNHPKTPKVTVIRFPRQRRRPISPDVVRDVVNHLIDDYPDGMPVGVFCRALTDMGYKIHTTFCVGALMKKGSGFLCSEGRVWRKP
jgi:hypothetical protein